MNLKRAALLLLALLLTALPVLAEADAAQNNADAIFMPALMSEMYNQSIPLIFQNADVPNLADLQDAMTVQYLNVTDGTLFYSTIDGNFVLLFDCQDQYTPALQVKAVTFYAADAGREVPLYPFFFAVSAMSGDMDFFSWAVGEHEAAFDIYNSESFNASYVTSDESISVQLSPAR